MNQYCTKCGGELRGDATFCPHCGSRVAVRDESWDELGGFLARACLWVAKGFLMLLLGGTVFACGAGGVCLLISGAFLLYHFAFHGSWLLPAALAARWGVQSIGGAGLLVGGIASLFIALLFVLGAFSLCKLLKTYRPKQTA